VQTYSWWLWKLNQRDAVIHWSREEEGYCLFYVSAWRKGREVVKSGVLNEEEQQIRENVQHNIAQGWQQAVPHLTNDLEVMILGGGPSLADFEADIKAKRAEGVKLITLNGTYHWALEHGLIPSALVMVDARPFNARFSKPVVDDCKYLIASQCHPSVFEGLPSDRTYLFHATGEIVKDLLDAQYDGKWMPVPGGSTAMLRAIMLLRMLGYRKFHLYGCDSCVMNGAHHAYAQPENDKGIALPVTTNPDGRAFYCHGWMISQAQEFMEMIRMMGEEIELEIYGDGLLRHILVTGAQLSGYEV
jgi:hypothetical protein